MRIHAILSAFIAVSVSGCAPSLVDSWVPPVVEREPVPTRDGYVQPIAPERSLTTVDPLVPTVDPLVEPAVVPVSAPVDPYTLQYNPDAVITLRGPITGFRRIPLADEQTGLFVRVLASGGQSWVYLGPEAWLLQRVEPLTMTQTIAVTGSMGADDRQSVLIARQVSTRAVRVTLRDIAGTPYWTFPTESVATRLDRDREAVARREVYLQDRLSRVEREEAVLRQRLREIHDK